MTTDISSGSIVSGYITLQPGITYTLTSNLVIDGQTCFGFTGGDSTTQLNGQGYTITVTDASYSISYTAFSSNIHLSNLVWINPHTSDAWGAATPDSVTCYAFVGGVYDPIPIGSGDIEKEYISLTAGNQYLVTEDLLADFSGFSGFNIVGTGNTILDFSGHTVTMISAGAIPTIQGLIRTTSIGSSLMVKNLNLYASGINIANGIGIVFGINIQNMIAVRCNVVVSEVLTSNTGGIFGGNNNGFICATECSVSCHGCSNSNTGGGGGICGGNNENAVICITNSTVSISGSVENPNNDGIIREDEDGGGGGGGICGGGNGLGSTNTTIVITGCTTTITGDITNNGKGGGGGICGGYNGGVETTNIQITGCTVRIAGSITNNSNNGGGGGIYGGYNGNNNGNGNTKIMTVGCSVYITGVINGGAGGIAGGYSAEELSPDVYISSMTECFVDISGIMYFGNFFEGINIQNNTIVPHWPIGFSLQGTTVRWTGGVDVSYTILIDGIPYDHLRVSVGSYDISSQLSYGSVFSAISIYNSIESIASSLVVYPPQNIGLSGTQLSWRIPTRDTSYNILYSVLVDGIPTGLSGTQVDISAQLQNGSAFSVISSYNGIESAASSVVVYPPQGVSIHGTTLSWSPPPANDVSFSIYTLSNTVYTYRVTTDASSYDVSSFLHQQIGIFYVTSVATYGDESAYSNPAYYIPAPSISISGSLLTVFPLIVGATYKIYNSSSSLYTGVSSPATISLPDTTLLYATAVAYSSESASSNKVLYFPSSPYTFNTFHIQISENILTSEPNGTYTVYGISGLDYTVALMTLDSDTPISGTFDTSSVELSYNLIDGVYSYSITYWNSGVIVSTVEYILIVNTVAPSQPTISVTKIEQNGTTTLTVSGEVQHTGYMPPPYYMFNVSGKALTKDLSGQVNGSATILLPNLALGAYTGKIYLRNVLGQESSVADISWNITTRMLTGAPTNSQRMGTLQYKCCNTPVRRYASYADKARTIRNQVEQMCCPVAAATSPTNLSLKGTILTWTGTNALYNVYVVYASGRVKIGSLLSEISIDVYGSLNAAMTLYVTAVNSAGRESPSAETYILYPTNLRLTGTVLSWSGPTDVSFNLYIGGAVVPLTTSQYSMDISAYVLPITTNIYITTGIGMFESAPSITISYIPSATLHTVSIQNDVWANLSGGGDMSIETILHVNNLLYAGGRRISSNLPYVGYYDFVQQNWIELAGVLTLSGYVSALCQSNDRLYAGGKSLSTNYPFLCSYDASNSRWDDCSLELLLEIGSNIRSLCYADGLVYIGGNKILDILFGAYNPSTTSYSDLNIGFDIGIIYTCIGVSGSIYLFGRAINTPYITRYDIYSKGFESIYSLNTFGYVRSATLANTIFYTVDSNGTLIEYSTTTNTLTTIPGGIIEAPTSLCYFNGILYAGSNIVSYYDMSRNSWIPRLGGVLDGLSDSNNIQSMTDISGILYAAGPSVMAFTPAHIQWDSSGGASTTYSIQSSSGVYDTMGITDTFFQIQPLPTTIESFTVQVVGGSSISTVWYIPAPTGVSLNDNILSWVYADYPTLPVTFTIESLENGSVSGISALSYSLTQYDTYAITAQYQGYTSPQSLSSRYENQGME